ncbi:hypothetical protein ACIA5C_05225 [Actinoplanes sp. NPDC051343]|jgi:hypothetical protein|uniref:hypothetical protein n=1 Tax=Actinoplanes sp. NPDC051343 TaxID=3363906 RepID=UPI0037879341
MRTRRTQRIDLDEADRLVTGDPPGPTQAGLGTLLEALRAPGTPGELSAEKAAVAAFRTHRKRAARAARRRTSTRAVLVPTLAALALLMFGGTALAARTGNLPDGAQQHAHHLFSALGVPAPRTGPTGHPTPVASAGPSPSRPTGPAVVELGWCADWQPGGTPLSGDNHRRLRTAAGGEQRIPDYCDRLRRSAPPPSAGPPAPNTPRSAPPSESTPPPSPPPSPPTARTTPSHPAPAHPTPSHHQPTPGGPGKGSRPNKTPK